MITKKTLPIGRIIWSLRHTLVFFLLVATLIASIHHYHPWEPNFQVSVTVIGLALSIFLGSRVKFSYDRWWEGRKLWGRMINRSRIITRQFLNFIEGAPEDAEALRALKERLVQRHIAYVHTLRVGLRKESIADDESCQMFLSSEDIHTLSQESNPCNALIQMQGDEVQEALNKGWLSPHLLQQIDLSMVELLDVQGGCERIKKTPLPATFTYFPTRLVFLYAILLAVGLVQSLHWWTIPVVVVVGFVFRIIDIAGRLIEDPFNTFYYALPLYAMSRTIEANLCDRINKPARPIPTPQDGVLM